MIDLKPAGLNHFIASYVIKAKKIAIIETGPTATVPNLLTGLEEIEVDKRDVGIVAVSHIHLDHSGGAGTLLSHLPNAKLVVHKRGAPHIVNPIKLWAQSREVLNEIAGLYGEPVPVDSKRMILSEEGMTYDLGENVELRVIETLGHASHHQSFYEKRSQGIFPGDTAGVYIPEFDAMIPTTPPPFHLQTTFASIQKLQQLRPKQLFFSHFGRARFASERLRRYSNQLRLWADIVVEKLKMDVSVEDIREEIEKRDPYMCKVRDHVKTHPIINKGTIPQSIEGFIEYFQRIKGGD